MKKYFFTKNCLVAVLAIMGLLAVSCAKTDGGPDTPESQGPVFDFETRAVSTLKVQYDVPQGYLVYFEVYTENPEYLDEDGQIAKKDIEPIDVGFTDANGLYNHRILFTATTKTIYIYSPYAGVPRIMTAEVKEDGITEARLPEAGRQAARQAVRAADDYKDAVYNTIVGGNLKRIGYWINGNGYQLGDKSHDLYGRPDYMGDKITVSADILNLINQVLPEGGGKKVDPELIKNADIRVTEDAHVDLHLLDEQTSANSTLAYYCYDSQNPPQTVADIEDIIIALPNSKVLKYHSYKPYGYNGALERGEGVRLHYWKGGKDMGDVFPANTSIGWVIYNQAYAAAIDGAGLNAGQRHFFGSKELNSDKRGHVALFRSGDKVIFGFEDWNDYDYNDVVFYVKSDPIEAITPDIPEVKPEVPGDDEVVATVVYRGILSFEDMWPQRKDFDMNDVVVSYESSVGYNKKNEVLKTDDKYTVLHSGASINNSFAYQLDVRRNEIEIEIASSTGDDGGAYVDPTLDRATLRLANNLLDYANNPVKRVFDVTAKYTGRRIVKDDFTLPPYNPFITTYNQYVEVHLTNMRPTETMDKKMFGTGDDSSDPNQNLYYITFDEQGIQMPFALNIAFDTNEEMSNYVYTREAQRIDIYYPGFINWITTDGRQDKDWYLKPKQ